MRPPTYPFKGQGADEEEGQHEGQREGWYIEKPRLSGARPADRHLSKGRKIGTAVAAAAAAATRRNPRVLRGGLFRWVQTCCGSGELPSSPLRKFGPAVDSRAVSSRKPRWQCTGWRGLLRLEIFGKSPDPPQSL